MEHHRYYVIWGVKAIIAKISRFINKNAKFLQDVPLHKKKRGTSSPVDGPGSFDQPKDNINNFSKKVNRDKKQIIPVNTTQKK
jgi:hypothetical protein